jgi:hypothetical protein
MNEVQKKWFPHFVHDFQDLMQLHEELSLISKNPEAAICDDDASICDLTKDVSISIKLKICGSLRNMAAKLSTVKKL